MKGDDYLGVPIEQTQHKPYQIQRLQWRHTSEELHLCEDDSGDHDL